MEYWSIGVLERWGLDGLNDKNSLFVGRSIGKLSLYVKGKTPT